MVPRHVTSLAAIFVCNLLLSCAQSAPNAALLKLMAARQYHENGNRGSNSPSSPSSSSSFIREFNSPFPSNPAVDGVNELWLDSTGSNPMLMSAGNSLTSAAGSPKAEPETEEGEEEAKDSAAGEARKRFHPSAFFGSRGKRLLVDFNKRFFHQGFVGSRGKRMQPYLLSGGRMGDEVEEEEEGKRMSKRFIPTGFIGGRGKRYLPGLEALFLSQMYKKLDAEKWKRQSLLGFHAARG
ncbi:uncharacterized protein LOC143276573 [Babylonia areolata]|uniref:uncharacterized protein LOC143276573 n=1 Tax=Babylonia areolata TaxID=304850 RepID=UPI003FD4C5DB